MDTQGDGNMAGRLLFIVLFLWGCVHSPIPGEEVISPVPIKVSEPRVYQNLPGIEPNRLKEPSFSKALALDGSLANESPFNGNPFNGIWANGIQVFLRPASGTGTSLIHLVMPYKTSLQSPEKDLLAKLFLVGDERLPEEKLLGHWQHLGNQIQLYSLDNQVVFRNRILTGALEEQMALLARLLSDRDLEGESLERQWRHQRVLFAANNRTALDIAKPFYKKITRQNRSPAIKFSNDPDTLKTEVASLKDKAFCLSDFRLFLESDMPRDEVSKLLDKTLGQLKSRREDCRGFQIQSQIRSQNQFKQEASPINPRIRPIINPGRIYLLDKKGSRQVEILVGMPTVSRNHRDWEALTLLADILGAGSGGRLFQDLRERQGLTYGVTARHKAGDGNSDLLVRMKTRPEKTAASLKGILAHIEKLVEEPVYPGEIRIARAARDGKLMRQLDSAYGRLALNAYAHRFDLPLDRLLFPKDSLPLEKLHQAAARYFSNPWLIILVGDATQISGQLNQWFPSFDLVRIPAKKAMEFEELTPL
jgi:hypothetical protein